MSLKLQSTISGVALLFCFMLFSSLECNYDADKWECTQESVDKRTMHPINDWWSYELNPPKIIYNLNGPWNICPRRDVEVEAGLLCKKAPPIIINAICYISTSPLLTDQIDLNIYDSLYNSYTIETTFVKPYSSNDNVSSEINSKIEITWSPLTPYSDIQDLKEFVTKYFDEIYIQYTYYEFRP